MPITRKIAPINPKNADNMVNSSVIPSPLVKRGIYGIIFSINLIDSPIYGLSHHKVDLSCLRTLWFGDFLHSKKVLQDDPVLLSFLFP